MEQILKYDYKEGWPKNIITRLNISAGLYRRNYKFVKIGITSDPESRFTKHKQSCKYNWEKMVVVYKTTSIKNANVVEKWFIENRPYLVNKWTGYSNMCDSQYYYAYFLLGN